MSRDYTQYAWLKGLRGADLNDAQFRVLVMAATWADSNTGESIHPGTAALVEATRLNRSTVIRALNRLVAKGYLEKVARGGTASGRRLATTYRIVTDRPATPVAPAPLVAPAPPVAAVPPGGDPVAPVRHPSGASATPSMHVPSNESMKDESTKGQDNSFRCERCGDDIETPGTCPGCTEPPTDLDRVTHGLGPVPEKFRTIVLDDLLRGASVEQARDVLRWMLAHESEAS